MLQVRCTPPPAPSLHGHGYFHLIYAFQQHNWETRCDPAEFGHHLRGDGINHFNASFALIYFRDVVILEDRSLDTKSAKHLVGKSCHSAGGTQGLLQEPAWSEEHQKRHKLITCYCAMCRRKFPFLLPPLQFYGSALCLIILLHLKRRPKSHLPFPAGFSCAPGK